LGNVPVRFFCFDTPFVDAIFADDLFEFNNLTGNYIKNREFPIFGEVELVPAFRPLYGMKVQINLVILAILLVIRTMVCSVSMCGFYFIREYFLCFSDVVLKKINVRSTSFSHIDIADQV